MDFIQAKAAAAREIALAFGVPPMLLGLPGDNTYSNYAEANRSFWRQTVIPLVTRTAQSLAHWLGPAYGGALRLEPDLDGVDALAPEREALWARIGAAGFLTDDEKREAVGYGAKPGAKALEPAAEGVGGGIGDLTGTPIGGGGGAWENQPRVTAGNPDGAQWTSGGDSGLGGLSPVAEKLFGQSEIDHTTIAAIWDDLEQLGGGKPRFEPTPKGAKQWIFPNGGIIRSDLLPGQYVGRQVPHINLEGFPGQKDKRHNNLK